MSTSFQTTPQTQDKENTSLSVPKKSNEQLLSAPIKKAILGDKAQMKLAQDEQPTSPLGAKLLQRKRQIQGQVASKFGFEIKLTSC